MIKNRRAYNDITRTLKAANKGNLDRKWSDLFSRLADAEQGQNARRMGDFLLEECGLIPRSSASRKPFDVSWRRSMPNCA